MSQLYTTSAQATSRIDGRAKVTGAAKHAGEFAMAGLAHASLVTSTIAKGRIARIDTSEALFVEGVLDVVTHQNRPRMASAGGAYKDDAAPDGSPFRPLYDSSIRFSGQPVALVVAEEPEIARFAASLVRVEYDEEAHATDVHRQRHAAFALAAPTNPAENPFARQSRGAGPRRHLLRPQCDIEPSIMSRSSITTRWNCTLQR